MSIHTTYDTKGISKLLTVHAINSAFDMSAPSFKTNILMGSTWYSPNKITILTKLGPRYSLKQDKVKDYDILGWNWCKYIVAILNFQTVSIQNITRVAKKKIFVDQEKSLTKRKTLVNQLETFSFWSSKNCTTLLHWKYHTSSERDHYSLDEDIRART